MSSKDVTAARELGEGPQGQKEIVEAKSNGNAAAKVDFLRKCDVDFGVDEGMDRSEGKSVGEEEDEHADRTRAKKSEILESDEEIYPQRASSLPMREVVKGSDSFISPVACALRSPPMTREEFLELLSVSSTQTVRTSDDDAAHFGASRAPLYPLNGMKISHDDLNSSHEISMLLSPSEASPRNDFRLDSPGAAAMTAPDGGIQQMEAPKFTVTLSAARPKPSSAALSEVAGVHNSTAEETRAMQAETAVTRDSATKDRVGSVLSLVSGGRVSALEATLASEMLDSSREESDSEDTPSLVDVGSGGKSIPMTNREQERGATVEGIGDQEGLTVDRLEENVERNAELLRHLEEEKTFLTMECAQTESALTRADQSSKKLAGAEARLLLEKISSAKTNAENDKRETRLMESLAHEQEQRMAQQLAWESRFKREKELMVEQQAKLQDSLDWERERAEEERTDWEFLFEAQKRECAQQKDISEGLRRTVKAREARLELAERGWDEATTVVFQRRMDKLTHDYNAQEDARFAAEEKAVRQAQESRAQVDRLQDDARKQQSAAKLKIASVQKESDRLREDLAVEQQARALERNAAASRTNELERQVTAYKDMYASKGQARDAERKFADETVSELRQTVCSFQRQVGELSSQLAEEKAARVALESVRVAKSAEHTTLMARMQKAVATAVHERDVFAEEIAVAKERLGVEAHRSSSFKKRAVSAEEGLQAARQLSAVAREATTRAQQAERALTELRRKSMAEKRGQVEQQGNAAAVVSGLKREVLELKKEAAFQRQTSEDTLAREIKRRKQATAELATVQMEMEKLLASTAMKAPIGGVHAKSYGQPRATRVVPSTGNHDARHESTRVVSSGRPLQGRIAPSRSGGVVSATRTDVSRGSGGAGTTMVRRKGDKASRGARRRSVAPSAPTCSSAGRTVQGTAARNKPPVPSPRPQWR